jgi:hypothetical protein
MNDRTKLLIHLRRLSNLLGKSFREGPNGTLEGKYALEHPHYIHYTCGIYLAGCLAFLEGEDGSYSWNKPGSAHADFDSFASSHPASDPYLSRGISGANLDALAELRNAIVHNDGDLALNKNPNSLAMVRTANLPGVVLSGSVCQLEAPFLEYTRLATLAVRQYHGSG